MKKINFNYTDEFIKECENLSRKKCKTLRTDLEVIKKAMKVSIPEHHSTRRINIYAYIPDSSTIIFIQLYMKNKNEVEDRKRIYNYFKE